jgi:hypothetical protein
MLAILLYINIIIIRYSRLIFYLRVLYVPQFRGVYKVLDEDYSRRDYVATCTNNQLQMIGTNIIETVLFTYTMYLHVL